MVQLLMCVQNVLAPRLPKTDRGATAVEYGLIVALIAAAIAAILLTLGGDLTKVFTTITTDL